MNQYYEMTLGTPWLLALDKDNTGKETGWQNSVRPEAVEAFMPGLIQDTFSDYLNGVAWYWNRFTIDDLPENTDCFLKVGSSEPIAEFWLNGQYLGKFVGRYMYYELKCSDAVRKGENLLAVRIVVPGDEEIDGYTYEDLPIIWASTAISPAGGIKYETRLAFRPKLRVDRAVVRADLHTGSVEVDTSVHNGLAGSTNALTLCAEIRSPFGETVAQAEYPLRPDAEDVSETLSLRVADPLLWDTETPFLYELKLSVLNSGVLTHSYSVTFGFREFIVKDGWFFLNGKRRFFKTTYVMDSWHPMGALENDAILFKELTQLKSMGFDSIRFENYAGRPEILDMCDRMGIIVIESHGASWHLKKGNRYFEKTFYDHLLGTIAHDINHPSILAWELVNEYHNEGDLPVQSLQAIRDLDMTRVVFLGSGRWDNDMRVGSISNPGSREWECLWGAEDPNAPAPTDTVKTLDHAEGLGSWTWEEDDLCCWAPNLGDVHIYARIPLTWRGKYVLRNHAKGLKPAYVSETGSNSMPDSLSLLRRLEQEARLPQNERVRMCKASAEFFEAEWERFGLGEMFPFPEDMVRAADVQNAQTRLLTLDCIRSNPQFAGLDFSCLSSPYSGFGALNWFRERRPYVAEMVGECMAPLHWCTFVEPAHIYRGGEVTIEAVLADNGVLRPGTYPVCARLQSAQTGRVWEKKAEIVIEEPAPGQYIPFSHPAIKETFCLDVPEGDYALTVYLEHGGAPTGGRRTLHVSEKKSGEGLCVKAVGLGEQVETWIRAQGAVISDDADVILVGDMEDTDENWNDLYSRADEGARVVFLKPQVFLAGVDEPYDYYTKHEPKRLPLEQKGVLHFTDSWAYRINTVLKNTKYTRDLQIGLLNDDLYDQTEPIYVFEEIQTPDEVTGVVIDPLYIGKDGDEVHGWISGVTVGEYRYGKGTLVLNSFRILNELGHNPFADRLMLNFMKKER